MKDVCNTVSNKNKRRCIQKRGDLKKCEAALRVASQASSPSQDNTSVSGPGVRIAKCCPSQRKASCILEKMLVHRLDGGKKSVLPPQESL